MVTAVKQIVTIQSGGRAELSYDELPEGRQAEVIVLVERPASSRPYLSLFGAGKGAFPSAETADAFLRGERDAWDR